MEKKYIKIILILIPIIILIGVFSKNISNEPNKQIITNILSSNTITIDGSYTNIINPHTNWPPDHVSTKVQKQHITNIQIIESGYDFINKKYFCLFEFVAQSDEYILTARAIMLLYYDQKQNSWRLIDEIGVLYGNYEIYKYR